MTPELYFTVGGVVAVVALIVAVFAAASTAEDGVEVGLFLAMGVLVAALAGVGWPAVMRLRHRPHRHTIEEFWPPVRPGMRSDGSASASSGRRAGGDVVSDQRS